MSHHTRGRKADPKPLADALDRVPKAPATLSAEARAEWRRVMPVLIERRVLTTADLGACEAYCAAVGDVRAARGTIAEQGAYLPNRLGELKRHPAFSTLREATGEARRWAAELGITPASRSRVAGGDDGEDDAGTRLDL